MSPAYRGIKAVPKDIGGVLASDRFATRGGLDPRVHLFRKENWIAGVKPGNDAVFVTQ